MANAIKKLSLMVLRKLGSYPAAVPAGSPAFGFGPFDLAGRSDAAATRPSSRERGVKRRSALDGGSGPWSPYKAVDTMMLPVRESAVLETLPLRRGREARRD